MALIPKLDAIGQRTGTKRTQVAIPSKNVPNISKITATIRQNMDADRFIPTMGIYQLGRDSGEGKQPGKCGRGGNNKQHHCASLSRFQDNRF